MREAAHPTMNFAALLQRIEPLDSELIQVRRHRITAQRRLISSFDVVKMPPIGSHSRGTAITRFSDFDVMAVLRRNEAKWGGNMILSNTLLDKIREDLQDRYVHTDVRGDQQAVVLDFAAGQESLDIVPALFLRMEKLRPVYGIPDGFGGWLESSPEAHNLYFSRADERAQGKLKRAARLVKWWKNSRARAIPMLSFHIDMLLAQSDICVGVKSYAEIMYEAFRLLNERECRGLRDPAGIAGTIPAARTEAQWQELVGAVDYALRHARAALLAQGAKDFAEANRQWEIVFNGAF